MDVALILDNYLEIKFGIGGIGRIPAHVVADAGSPGHRPHNSKADRVLVGQQAYALCARYNIVVVEVKIANFRNLWLEFFQGPEHVIDQFLVNIVLHAANAVGRKVHAVAVHGFLDVLDDFAHFHDVHEKGLEADDMGLDSGIEHVRGNALDFFGQHAQVTRPHGHGYAQGVFHGHAVCEGMAVGAKRTHALGQGGVLYKVSFGGHCFHAAVHMAAGQADVADGFALNLKLEIDGFFQGHMHGAQRQVKGV